MIVGSRRVLLSIALAAAMGHACAQSATPLATAPTTNPDWTKSEIVTVTMTEYEFAPRRLVFHVGVPTRLRLLNIGTEIHDFTAPDLLMAIDLKDPKILGSSGIGVPVEPHQQKDVEFVARVPGHFGLICADHDWAGMVADIVVE